ncbi:MAG: hypothetical protein KJ767_03725 [Nanoarchaeota archaeon]|nr:hypothetical protein [Nanoarchaeota archaeon]
MDERQESQNVQSLELLSANFGTYNIVRNKYYVAAYNTPKGKQVLQRTNRIGLVLDALSDIMTRRDEKEKYLNVQINDSFFDVLKGRRNKKKMKEEDYLIYKIFELYAESSGIGMNLQTLRFRLDEDIRNNRNARILSVTEKKLIEASYCDYA